MFSSLARKRNTDALKKKHANVKKRADVTEITCKTKPKLGTLNHRKHMLLNKIWFLQVFVNIWQPGFTVGEEKNFTVT